MVIDNLAGSQVARSDFDSVMISPSVTLSTAYTATDRIELRPSISVNYSVARLGSYRESGTSNANLSVDDRTVNVLTSKLQLATAYQAGQDTELELRVGARARNTNADDIDVSIAGQQFSYDSAGDDNVSGGFAGVNLRVATINNFNFVVDVELGGDSDEDYSRGQLSLEYHY